MKTRHQFVWFYAGLVIAVAGLGLYVFALTPYITDSPFSITWSESGRIFNAYQIYARVLTGHHTAWPWLDPGRSILDGLVFLLPDKQIWLYRFWTVLLFPFFAFITSLAVIRKAVSSSPLTSGTARKGLVWLLVLWGMFFLLQGPVYYHVLLGVFAILWFYNAKKPILVLTLVVIGSAWEGLCRVNWFLMPAFVAVLLHILSTPFPQKNGWKYLRWPLAYLVAGGAAGFFTYLIFIKVNGFVIPFLDPRMHYAYFLYKLMPNAGYIGLIPGIILVSSLLSVIILYSIWKHRSHLHWLRILIMVGILTVFFAGSTFVSIRAGGGYDLHNYDSFLLLLFISGCFLGLDAVALDKSVLLEKIPLTNFIVLSGLIFSAVVFSYHPFRPVSSANINQSNAAIQQIISTIESQGQESLPVLFIDERQLLVYQMIPDVQMFESYDKIELMEMAMARNTEYEEKFSADIKNQKFSLIISEVLQKWPKHFDRNNIDKDWYENNVWVEAVSTPILTYYDPVYINQDLGFAIYAPK
jgi:hypothetical protein